MLFCDHIKDFYSEHLNIYIPQRMADKIVCFLSGFTLMVVGIYMFSKKDFNKHPYTLIYLACLSEAMMYFAVFQMNFPCNDAYNFKKVLAISTNF